MGRRPKVVLSSRPSRLPFAPTWKMWSIRLRPTWPLEFASPSEKRGVAEFSRMRADSIVDAHRNTMRPRTSIDSFVSASIRWTPLTRSRSSS